MEFRSKTGVIPGSYFDNEVAPKKNPDQGYSEDFVRVNAERLKALKEKQAKLRK